MPHISLELPLKIIQSLDKKNPNLTQWVESHLYLVSVDFIKNVS